MDSMLLGMKKELIGILHNYLYAFFHAGIELKQFIAIFNYKPRKEPIDQESIPFQNGIQPLQLQSYTIARFHS